LTTDLFNLGDIAMTCYRHLMGLIFTTRPGVVIGWEGRGENVMKEMAVVAIYTAISY
jgi:hypothetical protein